MLRILKDTRLIPAYLAFASFSFFVIATVWRSAITRRVLTRFSKFAKQDEHAPHSSSVEQPETIGLRANIKSSGLFVFLLRFLRLASCLGLAAISVISLVLKLGEESSLLRVFSSLEDSKMILERLDWIEVAQIAYYVSHPILTTNCEI